MCCVKQHHANVNQVTQFSILQLKNYAVNDAKSHVRLQLKYQDTISEFD
mgnify:CR=1 FL=1